MSLIAFFEEMVVLYIIGVVGFLARRKGVFNQHATEVLTHLLLSLSLPFLILYSMGQSYDMEGTANIFWLIPISIYILFISCILAALLRKFINVHENQQSVFEGLIIFGNQGFIGFALITSLFPDKGALYVTVFNLPYLILIWTYGVFLFVGKKESVQWSKIFLNPGILSTLIGLFIFIIPYNLPHVLLNIFKSIGSTTIPLSMLLMGALIANINFKKLFLLLRSKRLWIVTCVRLIAIPLFLFPFIFITLPFSLLATAILVSGMPAAPTIALYAQKYGGDKNYAVMGSAWTTLLSALTIPILYILLYIIYENTSL